MKSSLHVTSHCYAMAIALLITPIASKASSVDEIISFKATNFVNVLSPDGPSPVESIEGSFSLSFDPDEVYSPSTAGIAVLGLDALVNGKHDTTIPSFPPQFYYYPGKYLFVEFSDPASEIYSIAFPASDVTQYGSGEEHGYYQMVYEGIGPAQISTDYSYTVSPSLVVPEPPTYMLLGVGLLILGLFGKRAARGNLPKPQ